MKKYKRIFTIVLDSLGIGAMKDSPEYGDYDVDTLGHIAQSVDSLKIPNLQKLGMANLHPLKDVEAVEKPLGKYMAMREKLRKRYYDGSLGNDGSACDNTI